MTEILCAGCGCEMREHRLKFEEDLPTRTRCQRCQRCSRFVFPKQERRILVQPPSRRESKATWEWLIQIR